MDVIFVGEFSATQQVLHHVNSDHPDDQRLDGMATDLTETYCQLMIESRIPQSVPDTRQIDMLASLPATADLGIAAYISVPVVGPAGELYGTLCCLSRTTRPELGYRQENSLGEVAALLTEVIQRNQRLRERRHQGGNI